MKYIIVTGGVVSGIGKGITISSIGRLLKSSGIRVTSIKIDPYLNVDAGTMSPYEHGETFVLDDGGETDLDLGNYERFLDITLSGKHNITTGKMYNEVISKERKGDYLGKTVQIVPHVTDMIQSWIAQVSQIPVDASGIIPDVCLVEVGGTVGDIESMVFLEALRQFQFAVGLGNIMFIHVSLVPCLGEQKTKPTQHSTKELRSLGLAPDLIVCRSSEKLLTSTTNKISSFCQVAPQNVVSVFDVSNIYHVPLILRDQMVHKIIKDKLQLSQMFDEPDMNSWSAMAKIVDEVVEICNIAIVGKYTGLLDSYLSVIKSITHSAINHKLKINIEWVLASDLEDEMKSTDVEKYNKAWKVLRTVSGILIPGGFGNRGVEGMILAAQYARENKKPFFGICLGMQVAVIEYARNVLGLKDANSEEFDPSSTSPVVIFMPEINQQVMGGTMRLGTRKTIINNSNSLAAEVYGFIQPTKEELMIDERHRHRYEVNPVKVQELTSAGLVFSGRDETNERMEIIELNRDVHPFYFATQFHPEFKSRPNRPSPPFFAFIAAASSRENKISQAGILLFHN